MDGTDLTKQLTRAVMLAEIASDTLSEHKNPAFCTLQLDRSATVDRGIYLRIEDEAPGNTFVGRIVNGPYFVKEAGFTSGATKVQDLSGCALDTIYDFFIEVSYMYNGVLFNQLIPYAAAVVTS